MEVNSIQIKPLDGNINRSRFIDIWNQMVKFVNPEEPFEMNTQYLQKIISIIQANKI